PSIPVGVRSHSLLTVVTPIAKWHPVGVLLDFVLDGKTYMCGIIGIIGKAPVTPLLVEALRRLEYRGYDSAGVATLVNGHIERRRAEGKLGNLATVLERAPLPGSIGIGHTRWATHGAPTEGNAHPHGTARVSIVHNGIIENHAE